MTERIEGECIIPPGYEKVAQCGVEEDTRALRWSFKNRIAFLFDSENPEYLQFLQKCKEDTKQLSKALETELKRRNTPVWIGRGRVPKYKSHFRQMGFLIRPPFFYSSEEKGPENRMQKDNDRDNFILHFDQDHNLQLIRFWVVKGKGDIRELRFRNMFRHYFEAKVSEQGDYLKAHYGDWQMMASKIADVIEESLQDES